MNASLCHCCFNRRKNLVSKRFWFVLFITVIITEFNPLRAQWVQTGPENGWINCFTTIETNFFAGTSGGVYISTVGTYNWSQPDTGLWAEYISCLTTMGTDLFVAVCVNVFRSEDYGTSFELVEIEGISHNISSVAVIDTILFCAAGGEGL